MLSAPSFYVVDGATVTTVIEECKKEVFEAVASAYRLHASGASVNPDSYFLRYPDKPNSRIIALPAHLGGEVQKSGIKWIASFPDNTQFNLARASAVLILNDASTGYPLACLEASMVSAARTAASAALAAENMTPTPFRGALGVIGTGLIARATVDWLIFRGWEFEEVRLYDLNESDAERFQNWMKEKYDICPEIQETRQDATRNSSLIVFATTTLKPYIDDPKEFCHAPTVLHLSLRDINEDVVLSAQNITDDVDHALKANTSLHLTEIKTGSRDFVGGTLVDVLERRVEADQERPRIFSPFGLGVLDLAVGNFVLEQAIEWQKALEVPEFFNAAQRW